LFQFRPKAVLANFSDWHPLAKLGLWGVSIFCLAMAAQGISWLCGNSGSLLDSSSGRSIVLGVALLTLMYVMAWDRRPMSDYGVVASGRWGRQVGAGILVGLLFYSAYYLLGAALGVYGFRSSGIRASNIVAAVFAAVQALPVAMIQQMVIGGYLPSTLRDRHGRFVSVLLPALIFGIFGGMAAGPIFSSAEGRNLTIGMCLIATLLCLFRLVLGSLTFPVGLLAGAIVARRVAKKLDLLAYDPSSPWANWISPVNDPRQGVVMWALLATAIGLVSLVLWRRGEAVLPRHQPALDASFKRVLPFSNLLALAPLDLWLLKLREARWQVGLKYVPRLIVTLCISTVNTLLALPERWLAPKLLKHAVPDPVFIVGVHRSGTTHLHNLLSLDPQFCAPSTYQVFNPHGFLSGIVTTLLLAPLLTWRRPMDAVRVNVFSPQEEEFALAAMTPHCPYWFGCFPRLFASHERFIYPERMEPAELSAWRLHFVHFLRKLTFWSRKRPLLKSPYNTARVAELQSMFPQARFVHIARHPHAVYRSNMHLAEHGWAVFQLQDAEEQDSYAARFLRNYRDQEEAYYRDAAKLPPGQVVEVHFEDIEQDPLAVVKQIYSALGIDFSLEFSQRLRDYLGSISNYQKNQFQPLSPADQGRVNTTMEPLMQRWGYSPDSRDEQRRAA